jgi:stearoyl-CoA desaturase (delta-9 desaturase)
MQTIKTQNLISIVAFVCLCSLFWYVSQYGWGWLAISYVYYKVVVGFFGNQIAQHRYFSHRSFATTRRKEWVLYLLSLTTGVNPIFYALAHRHHHRHSDQSQDLHSVHNHWFDIFSPITGRSKYSGDIEISRVLSADQRKINHYWPCIFLCYVALAALVDYRLAVFAVLTGPAWNYLHMVMFRVWLVHAQIPGSYRNFETVDCSWNNKWIQLLDIGEGLHNNHHQFPNRYNQAVQPNEFDLAGWVVKKFFTI